MHNSQLSMNYFVSILYYFVFSIRQRAYNKKSALIFQNALQRSGCEMHREKFRMSETAAAVNRIRQTRTAAKISLYTGGHYAIL